MDFKGKISTDTRAIGRGDVFFALEGERFDGHDFITAAIEKGVSTVVYSNESKIPSPFPASVQAIRVADTLAAYGDWAAAFRKKSRARVIAVTGSSGKTTVKEMLAHVLSARYRVHKNKGTENNLVGVPKTLLSLSPEHEFAVIELGTNHPGEIARLSEIAAPDTAVVTRVGPSHLEGLGSIEGVRQEKLSIIRGLASGGLLWLNADDAILAREKSQNRAQRFTGTDPNADLDVRAESIRVTASGLSFRVGAVEYQLPCLGRHNVSNALLAIGVARHYGIPEEKIAQALAALPAVAGRLEVLRLDPYTFLNDSYNANPISYEAALSALSEMPAQGRKIVVAGDMLELGPESENLHRELGRQIARIRPAILVTAGAWARAAGQEAARAGMNASQVHSFSDAAGAGEWLRGAAQSGDTILVKGSRGMKMERVFECFTPSFIR